MRGGTTEDEVGRTRWANPVGPITVEGIGWQEGIPTLRAGLVTHCRTSSNLSLVRDFPTHQ